MKHKSLRLAVLIDGDNINPAYLGRIFTCASELGDVVVRRIYSNDVVRTS